MQTVSDSWKNAHEQILLGESFVEVSLDIADPDASKFASSADNGAIYISNSAQVTDGIDTKPAPYCTLEQNLWCLDGTRQAIPSSEYGETGFVSYALSDDNCIFSTKLPVISIYFEDVFDKLIPGITITWSSTYGEWADTFTVVAYNADEVVAEREVVGNKSVKSLVFVDIVGYNRIDVIVKKWCLPNHRARVEDIVIGIRKIYGKSELFDYSHKQTTDPVSTSLPKNEIKFSIANLDGEYNPYNTSGLSRYLTDRQEVKVRYGLKMGDGTVEWIQGGSFYLSEWYAKQNGNSAEFVARDVLEFMSDEYHDTDFVASMVVTGRTLYELAELVLKATDLPTTSDGSPRWYLDSSLRNIKSYAPLPIDSISNCLQMIANAGMCTILIDRNGAIRIEPLSITESDYSIDSFNSYTKPEITLTKPIKAIIVKEYSYTGTNYRNYDIEKEDVVTPVGSSGETITLDNPLITSPDVAENVGKWLATHLSHRATLDMAWRSDVRLDGLDLVTVSNAYTSNKVRMTDVEFKYNGAFRGTGKGKVI